MKKKLIRIVTHSGNFHVDDLFAVASLQLLYGPENTEVIRSRDPKEWEKGNYVVDVGNIHDSNSGRYDHHQHGGAGARTNGVPYSALGLVWKHHGEAICGSKEIADRLDNEMVIPIDLGDNGIDVYTPTHEGVHPYLIHRILVVMRPTWKEGDGDLHTKRFMELLDLARKIIVREIITARDTIEGEQFVRKAYDMATDKRVIVIDQPYPWQGVLSKTPDALYVVKPKSQGTYWEVECVRNDVHSFQNRKSLPEDWRGFRDTELAQRSTVADAVFCHNNGFIAVAESKQGALRLAELAVNA